LSRLDKNATAWIYPTTYHIKVAVRDRSAFWLSSGNWNNSNQPDIDPATSAADAEAAWHRDRDWHVIIEEPRLAALFEDYLLNDLAVAAAHNNPPELPGPPLAPPPLANTVTWACKQFFPTTTVTGTIKIVPLPTPDPGVYADADAYTTSSSPPPSPCTCSSSTSNYPTRRTPPRKLSSTSSTLSSTGRTTASR
jgi:hypothetical protein